MNRRISNKEQTNVEVLFWLTISFQKAVVFAAAFLFGYELAASYLNVEKR
jgi:hypothetical protein